MFDTIDGEISREDIIKFGNIPCVNRIVLSKNEYPDIDYVVIIAQINKDANKHYMDRNIFGVKKIRKEI